MRISRYVAALAAIGAIAIASPAAASTSGDEPHEDLPGLVDSADITGPPLLTGDVRPDSGSAEGEMVLLYALPPAEQLAKLAVGETVKSIPLGYGYVDDDGSFEIKLSDPALAEPYESTTGAVTVQVLTSTGNEVFSETTTLNEAQISGESTVAPEIVLDESVEALVEDAGDTTVEKSCDTTKVASLGDFWTYVGVGYITDSTVARMSFTYTKSAQSTLGVGLSATGDNGSFSASGTSTVGSSFSAAFPETLGNKGWQVQVRYGEYKRRCVGIGDVVTTYSAIAEQTTGGTQVVTLASAPSATYCVPEPKDTKITIASTKASTVSGGVQSKGTIGINLSAQTGYSTNTQITFRFLKKAQLCGTAGKPATGTPGQLVAKP